MSNDSHQTTDCKERLKLTVRFVGIDSWERAVFQDEKGRWFKTVDELAPDRTTKVKDWPEEVWTAFLKDLHTTDEFDGEPCYRLDSRRIEVCLRG